MRKIRILARCFSVSQDKKEKQRLKNKTNQILAPQDAVTQEKNDFSDTTDWFWVCRVLVGLAQGLCILSPSL